MYLSSKDRSRVVVGTKFHNLSPCGGHVVLIILSDFKIKCPEVTKLAKLVRWTLPYNSAFNGITLHYSTTRCPYYHAW